MTKKIFLLVFSFSSFYALSSSSFECGDCTRLSNKKMGQTKKQNQSLYQSHLKNQDFIKKRRSNKISINSPLTRSAHKSENLLQSQLNIKTCGLVSDKQALIDGKLSDHWAQELIGADLLKEELEKTLPPNKENWIMILDGKKRDHNILVQSLISDKGPHSVLPKLKNNTVSFFDIDKGSEADYREGKGYKQAVSIFETNLPSDYLFGYKKRAPSFINNSMRWGESKDIYEVFKSFSSSLSNTVIITTAGNNFPYKIDSIMNKASQNLNAILVGSFSPKGFVSHFSQSGKEVSILAPSDKWIASAGQKGTYIRFGGTSGSAPLVTGSLAGFEWLSGYHPTAKEAKTLLEKTALPSLHSHESPRRNGAGLLNSYKLGEAAKRLRKKCQTESLLCFKEEILKDENYHFAEDKNLKKDLKALFPNCMEDRLYENTVEGAGVENKLSRPNCKKAKQLFKELRQAVLLNPTKELLKTLSCLYKTAGFSQNATAIDRLALALSPSNELRLQLKELWQSANQKSSAQPFQLEKENPLSHDILRLMLGMGGFEEEFKLYEKEKAVFMASSFGEKALPLLNKAFKTNEFKLQAAVISSAERLGEPALPLLEYAFDTSQAQLQRQVIITAGRIGEKGLPILLKAIDSGELYLQWTAVSSAPALGEKALPLLNKVFELGNLTLQKLAVSAGGKIGKKALPLIERAFYTGHLELQESAVDSAEQIGDSALPFLESLLESKNLDQNIKKLIEYRMRRLL